MRSLLFLSILFCLSCARKSRTTTIELPNPAAYKVHFSKLSPGYTRRMQRRIEKFWYDRMHVADFSGMTLVGKNDEILFEHYAGWANAETGAKIGNETPLHVASVSKTVTAAIILRLVDEKKIQLTDKVDKYLRDFPYPDVRIMDLLTHRSGIPYYGYFSDTLWPVKERLGNADVLQALITSKLKQNFPANTHFAYSNTNFVLLALIAEKVAGESFPEVAKDYVFTPLEMKHSFFFNSSMNPDSVSQSYKRHVRQPFNELDFICGDKNLYTTARDLFRFSKGLYSNKFLSAYCKKLMFRGYSYEKPGKANYGLGIRIRELPGKKSLTFHTGWWHGNTSCLALMRPDSACAIVISNNYNRRIYAVNRISLLFGDYPFEEDVDVLSGILTKQVSFRK